MTRMFSQRSSGIEIMDDLNCSGEVVFQTLREIEFINHTLGGNAVTINGVRQLLKGNQTNSLQIVDLGCGGGDMLKVLKKKLNINGLLKGIDANPNIIEYAAQHNTDPSISFSTTNILSDDFRRETSDIVIATLFFHHFTNNQLVDIFSHLKKQARIGIVVNDLHRHPLAYHSIRILTKLFSKSTMVKYDAPLSVLRGFSKNELTNILKEAGINNYTINWKWAFRWQVIIRS